MKIKYDQYHNYSVDEFAENENFQQWIKFSNKDIDKFWKDYLQYNPQQKQIVAEAKKIVEASFDLYNNNPLSAVEKLSLKNTIFQQIAPPVSTYTFHQKNTMQFLKFAVVIFAIVLAPAYLDNKINKICILATEHTGANEIKEIILPDSSVVLLHANSIITFQKEMTINREVSFTGNAFFKIKHKVNQGKFIVHANNISIAVLGTEFIVNARSKATDIVLTKGKIIVSLDKNKANTIYMNPSEKVQIDTSNRTMVKTSINTIQYAAWTENKWYFSSTSLQEIAKFIYEYYGTETIFKNEKIKYLKISAVIPVTDLSSFINIISKTLDLNIKEYHHKLYVQF